jgi:hypothetical protein
MTSRPAAGENHAPGCGCGCAAGASTATATAEQVRETVRAKYAAAAQAAAAGVATGPESNGGPVTFSVVAIGAHTMLLLAEMSAETIPVRTWFHSDDRIPWAWQCAQAGRRAPQWLPENHLTLNVRRESESRPTG